MKKISEITKFISAERDYRLRCSAFKKCSYGDRNRNKKFRVLCNKSPRAQRQGLLSTVFAMLPNMIEARAHGYVPMVDLKRNSRSQGMLQDPCLAKKENAWEYYFTQPDKEISLEDVRQSRYVEEQIQHCANLLYYIGDRCPQTEPVLPIIYKAVHQNIHLQPLLRERVFREKRELFARGEKILGVGIRAGYRAGIMNNLAGFNNHPIVGSCAEYIKEIEGKLREWDYDSFFLEIDDRKYLEEIKKYFGKSCIYLERPRIHYFKDALNDIQEPLEGDRMIELEDVSARRRNEDYLVELYILAQCHSLYASRGTGHNFSFFLNHNKYSHVHFMDDGEFHYKGC